MELRLVQTLISGNWCPSRLSIRAASVFTNHLITRLCSLIPWILLPLLCRWHPCLHFPHPPPTPISHLKMFGRHLGLDSCTSPQIQPYVNWTPLHPGERLPCMDLSVTVEDVMVLPSLMVRNLGVILDDRLCCAPNIHAVVRSCIFAINNIWRIWYFLTKDEKQLLVQTLFICCLDNCNFLLAGLLWLNRCSLSRTLLHASFTIYPNSPMTHE